jgi:hypothetical protein
MLNPAADVHAFLVADAEGYGPESPLVADFEFTTDQAYLIHAVFDDLAATRATLIATTERAKTLIGIS